MTIESVEAYAADRKRKNGIMADLRARKKRLEHAAECGFVNTEQALLGVAYETLKMQLERFASGNIASTPIAMMLEDNQWYVDVTVHIPGVTAYSTDAADPSLAVALTQCAKQLNRQADLKREAARDTKTFGYKV